MSNYYGPRIDMLEPIRTIQEQANLFSAGISELERKNESILGMIRDITKRVEALEKTTKTSTPTEGNTEKKLAAIQAILKGE